MQQIAVNQMNGTSGGSLRQKLDLSDACQATDAFAMLFMQLMGQTIQPEALLQMQGEQPLAQTDAVLPAAAGTVGSMASGNEMQAMLADLIQNAGALRRGRVPADLCNAVDGHRSRHRSC